MMRAGSPVPAGLLGMLALVGLVESTLVAYRGDIATPAMEGWRFAAWAAERKAPGAEVLAFGDSLVKFGVLPRIVEERTGRRGYNLAASGGTMPSAFFLFQRALAAGARPRAVVADFAPLMLADAGPPTLQNYPELATLGDAADLARTNRDPGFFLAVALAKALPSYRWRFEIRALALAALDGRSGSRRVESTNARYHWERFLGAQPNHPDPKRDPNREYLVDGVSPAAWSLPARDLAYLDRFLALARDHRVPVYWLIPPLAPDSQARRDLRGSDALYDRLIRAKQAEFPGLVVLDARRSRYDASVYLDHMHLDRDGADALSRAVGDALAACPPDPGRADSPWVALPPFARRAEVAARGSAPR